MLSIYLDGFTEKLCLEYCNGYQCEDGSIINGMVDWVEKRINKYLSDENINGNAELQNLKDLLTRSKIFEILSSEHNDLITLWSNEFEIYRATQLTYAPNKTVDALYHIFNYDSFRSSENKKSFRGFHLAKRLGIDCCPYCNRNYTTTHSQDYLFIKGGKKEVFPSFDHFFSKGLYPLFAISFYNLIPSCNTCNSDYKGEKDTNDDLYRILHPYEKLQNNHFSFEFIPKDYEALVGKSKNIDLNIVCNNQEIEQKFHRSIEFFGIKENYQNNHLDLIEDIIDKKVTFSDKYLNELQNTFKLDFNQTYKILFETHFEDDKLHKRPFSKLKKDIFNNIKTKK